MMLSRYRNLFVSALILKVKLSNKPRKIIKFQKKSLKNNFSVPILAFSILTWNPFLKKDEEEPEDKLINTIKLSILEIQKGDFKKAEQMLHLSLRMAQDLKSKDGITYVYDIMANLAMEAKEFVKAEKLFADIMKLLLSEGVEQDDNKILHISSKIAHMAHLQNNFDKANQGFIWTLQKIEEKLKKVQNDPDLVELWGLTKNW